MLYLEHLNLVVRDMQQTLAFYKVAFPHWRIRQQGEQNWHGVQRRWLHFGDDYLYLTFNDQGTGENRDLTSNQVGLGHFAFVVNNLDEVIGRLRKAGYEAHHEGAHHPYRRNQYYIDPNGYEIEFVEYLSDVPALRNSD